MRRMQHARRQRRISPTEDDGKIQRGRLAAAHRRDGRAIVVGVKRNVVGSGDGQGGEGVDLDVGPRGGLGVGGDGLDDVGAVGVVGAGGADGVVGAVECDGVGRVAGPGQVLVGADDAEDLGVGVRDGVDDFVAAGVVAGGAAVGGGGVLGEGGGWEGSQGEGEEEAEEGGGLHCGGEREGGRGMELG